MLWRKPTPKYRGATMTHNQIKSTSGIRSRKQIVVCRKGHRLMAEPPLRRNGRSRILAVFPGGFISAVATKWQCWFSGIPYNPVANSITIPTFLATAVSQNKANFSRFPPPFRLQWSGTSDSENRKCGSWGLLQPLAPFSRHWNAFPHSFFAR